MKRISIFSAVAFLAGLGIGFFARSGGIGRLQRPDTRAADVAAIERLRQEDIEVTLSQDLKGLIDVWTEDGIRLLPGRLAEIGKKAIEAGNQKGRAEHPGFQVLSYVPEFKELQVVDGWGFEWGHTEATYKLSPEGPVLDLRGTFLRVLRRQSDGSWKFARVIVGVER